MNRYRGEMHASLIYSLTLDMCWCRTLNKKIQKAFPLLFAASTAIKAVKNDRRWLMWLLKAWKVLDKAISWLESPQLALNTRSVTSVILSGIRAEWQSVWRIRQVHHEIPWHRGIVVQSFKCFAPKGSLESAWVLRMHTDFVHRSLSRFVKLHSYLMFTMIQHDSPSTSENTASPAIVPRSVAAWLFEAVDLSKKHEKAIVLRNKQRHI